MATISGEKGPRGVLVLLMVAAALLTACAGMQRVSEDRTRPTDAYATLQGEDAVAALGKHATWPAGKGMTYLSVGPDGRLVLATASAENRVYAYRADTGKRIATIPVGASPKGVKIDPEGEFALVANEESGSVSVLDLEQLEAVKEIDVGPTPHNSVFSPKGTRAFVTLQGASEVAVVDMDRMVKTGELPAGQSPHNIDIETMAVVDTIEAGERPFWLAVRGNP